MHFSWFSWVLRWCC